MLDKKDKTIERKGLPKRNRRKMKLWKKILIVLVILFAIGCAGVFAMYSSNRLDISGDTYQPKQKTLVYSADEQIIGEMYLQNRTYVSLDQIPQNLRNALVAIEDSRFYKHGGVDYIGILRATVSNILNSSLGEGASTITQQLARILYIPDILNEQTHMDSVNRKFREISIARQIEKKYTKDQIMEMYFNEYYFGSAAYGIQEAAKTYFGKNVADLNLAECAMLAGIPQAPSAYAPNVDFEAAKRRQTMVLNRMLKEGYITAEECEAAKTAEITIVPWSPDSINNQIVDGYESFVTKALDEYASVKASSVMKERGLSEEKAKEYIRENLANGGYKIYTTINTAYQQDAIETMKERLAANGMTDEGDTGAIVSVDLDGAVLSYYGGDIATSQLDMANTPRQPGSNIKPLYYAAAIEKGVYSPASILKDEKTSFGGYTPQNYGGGYNGNVTLAQALVRSLNIPSVMVFNSVGIENAIGFMKEMGITTFTDEDYHLATALGGMYDGIKPYEMAAAFNTFNNNGVYHQPYFLKKIDKTNGEAVYDKSQGNFKSQRVMSADTASTMWNLLRNVVTSGTGSGAAQNYPTAGKTGTTDDERDLWFTGITGNVTTAVWIGNLDRHVIGSGSYVSAGIYGSYVRTLVNNDLIQSIAEGDSYKAPTADGMTVPKYESIPTAPEEKPKEPIIRRITFPFN